MRKLKVEKVEGRLWQAQQAKVERILSTTSGGSWLGQRQNVQRLKKKKKKGEKKEKAGKDNLNNTNIFMYSQ